MKEINNLVKHSSIYACGNILNRIGAFLLLPLYTKYLSVGEYGTLELVYSSKAIISSLLSIGLAHATLRFYFEYEEELDRKKVISTTLLATILIAAPFVLALYWSSAKISLMIFDDAQYAKMLNLAFVTLLLELSIEVGQAYLRAKEYSTTFVLVNFLQLLVQVGSSFYAVSVLKWSIYGVLVGNFLSVIMGWLVVSYVAIKECGFHFDFSKLKSVLNYSYPFLFSSVFSVAIGNSDRFFIKSYGTMDSVGLYSLAAKFGILMQTLFMEPFNRSFGAFRFSIMKQDNVKEVLSDILNYRVLGLLFFGMGIILFSKPVLQLMTAPDYWAAYKFIPLIILSNSISGLTYIFQTGILYEKKTRYMFYITVLCSIVTLSGNILLIPKFHTYGAIYSMMLTAFTSALATYLISQRLYPIHYDHVKVVKMYAVAILLIAVWHSISVDSIPLNIGLNPLYLLFFPVILYYSGCIKKAELMFVKNTLASVLEKLNFIWAKNDAS